MPVINRDAFELRGNAQDFNENSGAGSSDQWQPVSLLGWACKELADVQWILIKSFWVFNCGDTFIPAGRSFPHVPKGL